MSLFGALMGDLDDDPFLGGHMRRMNQMMSSFFRDPFQDMMMGGHGILGNELALPHHQPPRPQHRGQLANPDDFTGGMMGALMPGFPNLRQMFTDMGNGSGHMTSMSTVMTMSQGPDGRPQVYQASTSMRQGPGGVRETKKTVADSRTGVKKMSIGHQIYDRAHVIEREQNLYSGDQEERQEFINLDEDDADDFNKEWETKTRGTASKNAIGYNSHHQNGHRHSGNRHHHRRDQQPMLALPSSTGNDTHQSSTSRYKPRTARRSVPFNHNTPQLQSTSAAAKIASSQLKSNSGAGGARKRKNGSSDEEENEDEPKKKYCYLNKTINVEEEEVDDDDDDDDIEEEDDVEEDDEMVLTGRN